jgi:hypothetical protein
MLAAVLSNAKWNDETIFTEGFEIPDVVVKQQ